MKDLSIVIVSYNTKEYLRKCLNSIYNKSRDFTFEVIVVDNASSDGTEKEMEDYKLNHLDFSYIQNRENLGFSKANNIGIKKSVGKYILFLNPDIEVHEHTLKGMLDFMDQEKKAGAATCKVILPNGKIDDASHRGFPTPWNALTHFSGLAKVFGSTKLFGGYNLGYLDLTKTHEIEALAGAFMLARREAGEQANWWDEDYFFYGEDLDFCYILKQKGWKVFYVPKFSVLHYKGVSGGIKSVSKDITTANKQTKKRATFWRFEAMRIFYKKHYENKYPLLIKKLVYLGINFKQLMS